MPHSHQTAKPTNLQLELLKIFSRNLSETQLLEIKGILSRYFAEKATDEFEKLAEQKDGLLKHTGSGLMNITGKPLLPDIL